MKIRLIRDTLKSLAVAVLTIGAVVIGTAAQAGSLPSPTGEVVLIVSGKISNTNAGAEAHFDRAMLNALGSAKFKTRTEWTDGEPTFEGVPASKLMSAVGASGTMALGTADDGYSVEIPVSEFNDYPVIFALKMNGKELQKLDRGPIWIMYPWEKVPADQKEAKAAYAIWQLKSLEIK